MKADNGNNDSAVCEGSDVHGVEGVVAECEILKWTTGVGVIGLS